MAEDSITFKSFIETIRKLYKCFPKVMSFIPLLAGGIWQFIELAYIGLPMVRFMSITQILVDGILAIFILALLFIFIFIGDIIADFAILLKNSILGRLGFNFVIAIFLITVTSGVLSYLFLHETIWPYYWLTINYLYKFLVLLGLSFYLNKLLYQIVPNNLDNKKNFTDSPSIYGFFAIVFYLIFAVALLHIFLTIPKKLENNKAVICRVQKDYPRTKEAAIQYYNDKHIFIRLLDSIGTISYRYYSHSMFEGVKPCTITNKLINKKAKAPMVIPKMKSILDEQK